MSDETTQSIIDRITVKYETPQKIIGDHVTDTFFDCIRLTPSELARLAAQAIGDSPQTYFNMAVGLAYTGVFFASAVAGGKEVGLLRHDWDFFGPSVKGKKIVLVDDVVVNGNRFKIATDKIISAGGSVVSYACIVDRSKGKFKLGPLLSSYVEN